MWSLLLLLACPKRTVDDTAALRAMLDAADAAWELRTSGGLEPVNPFLRDAWSALPGHPDTAWRIVRQRIAEGLASDDPRVAQALFAEGRSVATLCLDSDGLFARRRADQGWAAAIAELPPERRICAAWGALAWIRWIERLGPEAASLDLETVDLLLGAVAEADDPAVADVAGWAAGLVAGLRPSWAGRDPAAAIAGLDAAVVRDPDSLVRKLDRWAVDPDPAALLALEGAAEPRLPPEDAGALAWAKREL